MHSPKERLKESRQLSGYCLAGWYPYGYRCLQGFGALDAIVGLLTPAASLLGIPAEAMPLVLMRPVSGSASLAIVSDIIGKYGPDSYVGRVVCTMLGSTETIFYTLAVYYGSVGIKNIRYTLAAALIADGVSAAASAFICALVFGR